MDLFSRYFGRIGGTPQRTSSAWSRDSPQLQGKQPTDTPLKMWARFNDHIKSDGSFQLVLWSHKWYDPNGHCRRVVAIPRYSKENSLQKVHADDDVGVWVESLPHADDVRRGVATTPPDYRIIRSITFDPIVGSRSKF
jgi:hypothetical protein